MATPTIPERRLLAAGASKSNQAWGTAMAIVAPYGILLEGDGGLARTQPYLPANEADTPLAKEGDFGPIDPVDFAPEFTMRYDPGAIGVLLSQVFGATAGLGVSQGSGVYEHHIYWATENYGEICTFAIERPSKIFEVASAKPYAADFSIADGLLKGTISLRGNTVINTSSVNTLTQMDALTYRTRGNRCKFSQCVISMNDQTSGDVGATTALEVSDLSIHYERPQDGLPVAGQNYIIEPAENAHPIITVSLTFPRMNTVNNAFFAEFIAETEKKMRIWFTGGTAGGALPYCFKFWFPRLRITAINYPWDEVVPGSMTLQAEEAATAPTAMTYAVPYIILQNLASADYLG